MKRILLLSIVLLAACQKRELSPMLEEFAVVQDSIRTAGMHGSGYSVGIASDGNPVTSITSVSIPEKYTLVFQCKHGRFAVEGEGTFYKHMWETLAPGQSVTISYREEYITDNAQKILVGYKFENAK